jgi:predicted PurR-regulated permease PerM
MEDEGLGFKFWGGMVAVVIGAGIAGMIILFLFSRAVYAWGFLGAFLALAVVLIAIAWFHDRRETRRYETE